MKCKITFLSNCTTIKWKNELNGKNLSLEPNGLIFVGQQVIKDTKPNVTQTIFQIFHVGWWNTKYRKLVMPLKPILQKPRGAIK